MDKNGNGSPAQFSPEELIRRLKSQLNINSEEKTENEAPAEEKNEDVVSADEIAPAEELATVADAPVEASDDVNAEEGTAAEVDETPEAEIDEAENEEAADEVATADESSIEEDEAADPVSSTVEFSISDLFANTKKDVDSVSGVEVNEDGKVVETEVGKASANDEDVDFFSFLAGSGISADKQVESAEDLDDAFNVEAIDANTSEVDDTPVAQEGASEVEPAVVDDDVVAEATEMVDEIITEDEAAEGETESEVMEDTTEEVIDEAEEAAEVAEESEEAEEIAADEADSDTTDVELAESVEDDTEDYDFDSTNADEGETAGEKPLPDFNMLIALGIPAAEVEKIYGAEAAAEYARMTSEDDFLPEDLDDDDEYEYASRSQNEEIDNHYRGEKILSIVKLCAAAVLFIFALFFENLPALGAKYSGWLDQSTFPIVHIMVDLQLVLVAAVLAYDELVSGVKALIRKSANAGSVLAAAILINVIYDIVLCFTETAKLEAKLSGASVIFAILLCLLSSALKLWAEIKSFRMISAKGVKCCVLTNSPDDMRERAAFFEKVSDDEASKSGVLSFGRTKFVGGFFHNQTSEHATVVDKILAPAAIVCAVIAFIVAYATSKDIGVALCTLNCSAAFLVPVSVFAAGTLTYAKACSYADSMKSAIIGENTPYDYADSSVVAFDDKDAYPSYCVKLRNLKVYGSIAIVDVLRITATLFRKIGGPLNDVLENATSEINKDAPIEITRSSEAGIEAVYNGKRILLGKADFLHSYGIIPYTDVDDREYLKTGDVSIMYVAVDNELSAKFYIQYTLDVDFEVLLRDLNRAGICVSIRTSDPNIDRRLLQAKLNLNKTALRIVYCDPGMGRGEVKNETESGIIGSGTPSELVHTAMLCDRVVHVYRTNNIIKGLSLAVGIALLILFALISVNLNVFSGLLIIYQLFWMIPTLVVSKLFL